MPASGPFPLLTAMRDKPRGGGLSWALLVVLIACPLSLRAESPLPQTTAGKLLGQFLHAFNSGDPARQRAFLQENLRAPDNDATFVDRMTDDQSRMFRLSKGMVVEQVVESSPAAIKV